MTDQVAEAIAAAETTTVHMVSMEGTFPSGRPFALQVPADLSELETLAFVKLVADLPLKLRQGQPRILVPRPV